ncbi:TIGR00341 family protein [Pontibacter sp. 13R65]|uniref:TIGR00341 family protein n=1 Tax=Pontibacter sp. 13R65 TaxID=3127458 RepID=UPI00301DAC34
MTKAITLLYDGLQDGTVQEKITDAFADHELQLLPFEQTNNTFEHVPEEQTVVCYLSDEQLKEIITIASQKKWTLGFLPHPGMKEARQGYGISGNLTEAIENVKNTEKGIAADLLLCNGRPVFNAVVIGNSLSLMSGSIQKNGVLAGLEKLKGFITNLNLLEPRAFTITTENKAPIKTAALGIVAVLHGKSTILSRQIIKNSHINDGRLHGLVLAPKSIMQLSRFYLSSFFRLKQQQQLPSFIGHIKTRSICISSPAPMDFSQDGNLMSAREIELEVSENRLLIIPGRYLKDDHSASSRADTYKIAALPTGDSYLSEIVAKPLSFIYHASTEEFKDLFKILRENAKPTSSYLTLMVLATLLATLGLFSDSSPVIIGAMILAPLMAPIISLSMGVLRQERKLIIRSAKTIGLGILLAYLAAVFVTMIVPLQELNSEISGRIRPNLLDLGVAIVSGIAGAYAHAREEVAKTLAGVAIAVALVPPVAVSGIGLGWTDWHVFTGALLLFLTNLTGIVLAGSISFMALGFSPFRLARKGLLISLLVVALVSIPLGYGFMNMVQEQRIVRSLNNQEVGSILINRVSVLRGGTPLLLRVHLTSDKPIQMHHIDKVKAAISSKLDKEVELEVMVSIRR